MAEPAPAGSGVPFRLLFVCTGNICRSPMAEYLLRRALVARFGAGAETAFSVSSAGTYGLVGEPMSGPALDLLAGRGIAAEAFRARELEGEAVGDADLVLALALEHRAAAVTLVPRAAPRCFTLREFARLATALGPAVLPATGPTPTAEQLAARARALVTATARMRGLVPAVPPAAEDVADPYRRSVEHYAEAGRLIEEALGVLVDRLAGPAAVQ